MSVDMEDIENIIETAVKRACDKLRAEFETANAAIVSQLAELKEENSGLKSRIRSMEIAAEKSEQYNRKTSLILGGNGIPPPPSDHVETTSETRAIAAEIIKNSLKVEMRGTITACHRLRNKKRVIVKFQDMEDRDAVYQARFDQPHDAGTKIIIHENLTEQRANMVKVLGQMREKGQVVNYHTKNGTIYARNSRDKKYTQIEPWLSEEDVLKELQVAPNKISPTSNSLLRSQTLDNLPHGHVASRAADLSEFVVSKTRGKTRKQANQTAK